MWCFFIFSLLLSPNTWLVKVRQTLYMFLGLAVLHKSFPEKSHSGQLKKAVSDDQWQVPWLGCKSKANMGQYLCGRQGGDEIFRAAFQPPGTVLLCLNLCIIETAFCPSYHSFYLCHGKTPQLFQTMFL